jgi:hypothetical protein
MDVTVAGLTLEGENDIVHPIGAVVVIKGLDAAGEVCYWSRSTDGLTLTEALGMAVGLVDDIRASRELT